MNKKLSLLLLLSAMIICVTAIQAQAASISFNIIDTYIETGESFDVGVYVQEDSAAGDLTGFGFDVDPLDSLSLFSYDGYSIGPDFEDFGAGSNIAGLNWDLLNNDYNPNAGVNVLLATLSFTAGSTAGTDTLSIEGLYDGWDRGLYYEDWFYDADIISSFDITINDAAPVPEPGTMFLLSTGLIGLAGFRRKLNTKKTP